MDNTNDKTKHKMTRSEVGALGGEATKRKHPEQFKAMGHKGGRTTLEKYGHDFYREIARQVDHQAVAETILSRDPGFYKKIGKKGGETRHSADVVAKK